ncbi:MAG: heavy-metal-associated domain-containing protein [Aeropyrum sp.]|nr:heavy-metal-associated domain-containing protein [Aeropyrum sp.]
MSLRVKTFKVSGIHCEGCAITIKTALATIPGVKNVNIATWENKVIVTYDPQQTTPDVIAEKIETLGYSVVEK